ncbi:hypothetical protein [Litorihabitans aurantiacus]|uniref:Uncharacterized protein n=1 Tax=Litorihabitans aurantiacus TaxID=1930061 RepID=A0AA37XDT3_9MICO|nr:hypothetical protein [Litorihabitans aurantiacus]GMA31007.1 hypothetical protein GCM10025875_09990 [Litorihabitans aurantiacus]
MALLPRRPRRAPRPPADVVRAAAVQPIAAAPVVGGGWLVLGAREWVVVAEEGDDGDGAAPAGWSAVERRPWHEVDSASWDADTSSVHVRWIDGTTRRVALADDHPGLPQVVRERVEASIAHQVVRDLPGGVQVRAVIRRDGEGALTSQVSVVGTDVASPEVLRAADEAEAQARAAVGLD